jgi:cyanophycinase
MAAGILGLVGGGEWNEQCGFDRDLVAATGTDEVLVLPTGAAYEHPQRLVEQAERWFAGLGTRARGLNVLTRTDAQDPANVAAITESRFIYLAGGSALHVRSVLKESAVWDAMVQAWQRGAALVGSSAGAMVMCDPMVDPRGGAFTLGLGLVEQVAVVPHVDTWSPEKVHRTLQLAPAGLPVVAIHEQTALLRAPDGTWSTSGAGTVEVFVDGKPAGLNALPG